MSKPKKKESLSSAAESFLNLAKQYHLAATTLLPLQDKTWNALHFLYTHAIELLLKAFLRSHRVAIQPTHKLNELIDECEKQGMKVHYNMRNVVNLLEFEYEHQGFRYFVPTNSITPSLDYLRDVADDLLNFVTEEVAARPTPDIGKVIALRVTMGKPQKKRPLET